jgi:ribonucleoside-diphosphate reductase alpha chain
MKVGAWVYDHIDEMSGVSFLPYSEHTYQQAPYQEISKEEYESLLSETPETIDWNWLKLYETEDLTTGSQELACVAGACDINDIK